MKMTVSTQASLLVHLVIEIPASINFLLRPSSTLSAEQPHSHGVIRQYGLLLFTTNIIVALLLREIFHDELTARIAGVLALYHIGPIARATAKLKQERSNDALGGPWLHLSAHVLCATMLLASSVQKLM